MQMAFYSSTAHFFFFLFLYFFLVIGSLLMNICVKLTQVCNLSNVCDPVHSPSGVSFGRYKHWILLLLSESS